MEYTMEYSDGKLLPQLGPTPMTQYFPSPGGPTIVPPITFAYMTQDGTPFTLHMQDQVGPYRLKIGRLIVNTALIGNQTVDLKNNSPKEEK